MCEYVRAEAITQICSLPPAHGNTHVKGTAVPDRVCRCLEESFDYEERQVFYNV